MKKTLNRTVFGFAKKLSNNVFGAGLTSQNVFLKWLISFLMRTARLFSWTSWNKYFFELRHPNDPWFAIGASKFINSIIDENHEGFEWGSGRSTLWFAERVRYLKSVEHNQKWYQFVSTQLSDKKLHSKVDYVLCSFANEAVASAEEKSKYIGCLNKNYDFIIVDGCFRPESAIFAINKVKKGGYIIIDNADREDMRHIIKSLIPNLLESFDDGIQTTSIYKM